MGTVQFAGACPPEFRIVCTCSDRTCNADLPRVGELRYARAGLNHAGDVCIMYGGHPG